VSIALAATIGYYDFGWIGAGSGLIGGNAAANAFIGGFVGGAINSGTLEGAVMGGFTSMAFFGAGQAANSAAGVDPNLLAMAGEGVNRDAVTQYALFGPTGIGRALLHAAAGCASSAMQGGDCGNGALSAGLNKAIGSHFDGETKTFGDVLAGTAQNAALGGTVSKLTGDSFANGAKTGATQYLNNAVVMAAPLIWNSMKIAGTTIAKAMVDEAINQVAADFTTDRELRQQYLSDKEQKQWSRGGMRRALTGKAWHWAVHDKLEQLYGRGEFTYNPSRGPDTPIGLACKWSSRQPTAARSMRMSFVSQACRYRPTLSDADDSV
jgi:hypothetical protein